MRVLNALFYGLIGSFLFPIVGVLLLLPAVGFAFLLQMWPTVVALVYAQPITLVSVPFVEIESGAWLVIPAFGAFFFAFGGALMRPLGDWKFDDVRLLWRFCREVMIWMTCGALFGFVWGAIFGWALADFGIGVVLGAMWGEIVGLIVGAIRGALVRREINR